ncbi:hypothetical protein SAMN06298214_0700 [Bacteroidales bacterium WCE2004]|nr:hypothetical protein SAMN06298214_0700 [Bacteroidales bacterium WCE2004]
MVRRFQVAGLTFSLALPDNHPVRELLHNYDPFEIEKLSGSQLPETSCDAGVADIFELTLTEEKPAEKGEVMFQSEKESGEPVVGLYHCGDGYLAEFAPSPASPVSGQLVLSGDFRHGTVYAPGSPKAQAFTLNNALMLLFAFASAPFLALEMHASVVTNGGRGFLFLGRSGTGKSTHSRLWLTHIPGTELLNDDNPVLRVVDGEVRVYGSPWSGKTPCYKAEDAPVGAIVRLRQAPENRIERLSVVGAYASVMASCSGYRPIRTIADAQHETLARVSQQVPCYQLDCLPDEAAARLCKDTVDG